MNTIWAFGDSYSTPYDEGPYISAIKYIEYKGYTPKIFAQVIAETMNFDCTIKASGGLDNYSIFQNVCDIVGKVKSGDIIIIGWSHINRFRIVNKQNEWIPILPFTRLNKFIDFNMDALDVVAVNRHEYDEKYASEVDSWIKLINKAYSDCIVYHWSPFPNTKINLQYFKNIMTITNETKNLIEDGHYSETGHKMLANIFLNMIFKKQKNELI